MITSVALVTAISNQKNNHQNRELQNISTKTKSTDREGNKKEVK